MPNFYLLCHKIVGQVVNRETGTQTSSLALPGCQVTSQAPGNVQVHKMFDTKGVFRKM